MKIGYSDSDVGLIEKLLRNDLVSEFHIDTELKKFHTGVYSELLTVRKSMSHKIYYSAYDPFFMPETSPKDVGFYKAALAWKKKVNEEVGKANDCMEHVFEMNGKLSEKLLKYLDS